MVKLRNEMKLGPNWRNATRSFGQSIASQGDILVVGSDDTPVENCVNAGTVHIYKRWGRRWIERQILKHPEPCPDSFYGWSVALDPYHKYLAVGADDLDHPESCSGAVYIYENDGDEFKLFQTLRPDSGVTSPETGGFYGFSVDIYGDQLIVGAPSYQSTTEELVKRKKAEPSVYFYMRRCNEFILTNYAKTHYPFFGGNVKVGKGGYLASSHKNQGGEVWCYSGKYVPMQILQGASYTKTFGKSMDTDGDWLAIGAPLEDPYGAVYLFGYINYKYYLIEKFTPVVYNGSTPCFGYDVSIKGDQLLISDPNCRNWLNFENYRGGAGNRPGYLYLFDLDRQKMINMIETESPIGGHSICLGARNIFEGNPSADMSKGEVNIYDYDEFRTLGNV